MNDTGFNNKILQIADEVEHTLEPQFKSIEKIAQHNQIKVLTAFRNNKISYADFAETSGYAYDDFGRDNLDRVFAEIFDAEDALVRHSITTGTQALALAFFGVLRPGDVLVSATGKPYDTLEKVIGIRGTNNCSLKDFGIKYKQIDLTSDGKVNCCQLEKTLKQGAKAVLIQRSRGYCIRQSFDINEIKEIIERIKKIDQKIICIVDNCYGEFVEEIEPINAGADLVVGSLIKNPGGGIAPCGGYVTGKKMYIDLIAQKHTAPGLGKKIGASLGINKSLYMGLYVAPHAVEQALKTKVFCARIFKKLGYKILPDINAKRTDIIQGIELGECKKLIKFCQTIQQTSPIDSHLLSLPCTMPGYEHQVIMASGSFIQGSSIELSADAPLKKPYIVYVQGGIIYSAAKYSILAAAQAIGKKDDKFVN